MFKGKSVLCTICARKGSKGIKNKNVRRLLGKPLIVYTIEQAKRIGIFDCVTVSTDSSEVRSIAQNVGVDLIVDRPFELAKDDTPKILAIRHALLESEKKLGEKFDIVVDLDVTAPLRGDIDIINALEKFVSNNYDNLVSVNPSRKSPYFNMLEVGVDGKVSLCKETENTITCRQQSPPCYEMNGAVYIWNREVLLNNDSLLLNNTGIYIMPLERSIDIDTEFDFLIVECLMKRKK